MAVLPTDYAPAKRLTTPEVFEQFALVSTIEHLSSVINAINQPFIIINHERQIVAANNEFLNLAGAKKVELIAGLRPGEAINCIHAHASAGGCGTSNACTVCGVVNAILDTQKTNTQSVKECAITINTDRGAESIDIKISANPLLLENTQYIIVSITDITDAKRRHVLERIFFHDVLNTTGGIYNLLSCMVEEEDPVERNLHLRLLVDSSKFLVNQILEQKELLAAESGELTPRLITCNSTAIIASVIGRFSENRLHKVLLSTQSESITFVTDQTLLERTLDNMVKNALEASKNHDDVTIQCLGLSEGRVSFLVHNKGIIPQDVQLCIFKRSFSTKAKDRGLGTYSIKLLTERYLKGTVGFASTEAQGTTFTITIPQSF